MRSVETSGLYARLGLGLIASRAYAVYRACKGLGWQNRHFPPLYQTP